MEAVSGIQTATGVFILAVAGMAGAFIRSVWNGIQQLRGDHHRSDQEQNIEKSSIISLAQSQMNDLNAALRVQINAQDKDIAELKQQLREQSDKIDAQARTIETLRDRIKELEAA